MEGDTYTIRDVERNDLDDLVALCKHHAQFEKAKYETADKKEELEKLLFSEQAPIKCWIVSSGEQVIGYCTVMQQYSTWNASSYLYLDCIYLTAQARNVGIGRKMMSIISDYARSMNLETIEWQTPVFNSKAIKFYERLGARSKSKERFIWSPPARGPMSS